VDVLGAGYDLVFVCKDCNMRFTTYMERAMHACPAKVDKREEYLAYAPAPAPAPTNEAPRGIGGGKTRATLPCDAAARKECPIASGVLDYFPDALAEIARVSKKGNDQHNPGQPLHWAREKSTDEADALIRHFMERGGYDTDGLRHSAKMAWRALALLQKELEADAASPVQHHPV
jgi:hypothetical protein